jgi:RNA polymerase sigma-70 factor (ECF subfamily)
MRSAPTAAAAQERELLAAARKGDEGAYRALVEPHRAELIAHCYRITGSVHDAEDAIQDAMLRAWRGLSRFEGRSSARSWLYRIATNACLDVVARRRKRVLPIDYGPPARPDEGPGEPLLESVWIEPCADESLGLDDGLAAPDARYEQRESVELAFVAALQHLPANQRAALILRDVLGFSAQEVAETLETTVASVNSALQRARQNVDERLPEQSQQATLRSLGDERIRELVERYMDAMQRGDVDAVVAMLAEDATWSMPPLQIWFRGRSEIARFLADYAFTVRWRHLPTRVNGQPTAACYAWDEEQGMYVGSILDVLTLEGSRIAEVTSFGTSEVFRRLVPGARPYATSELFRRFGLPDALPAQQGRNLIAMRTMGRTRR